MIFGITPKRFAYLLKQGKDARIKKQVDKFKTKQIQDLSFSDYVDLKRYFDEEDYHNFFCIFVVKKWYQVVCMHHSIAIVTEFKRQKDEIEKKYYWVFDPPQYGEPEKETIGNDLRNEFVQDFGNDVVIMDVICKGRFIDYKKVESWKVSEVLFWANYLYGQKIIENIK